jgi:hypothetical protein
MKEKLFDKLEWTDFEWQTSVEIPFFRSVGARFDKDSPGIRRGPTGASDSAAIQPNPPIPLTIDTGEKRRPPTKGQEEAWRRLIGADQVWQECITRFRAEYKLQRPARVRWWRAAYGEAGIDGLPEVADDASFASLIVPIHVRVQESTDKCAVADVGVIFACTWYKEGCGVLIRDGRVVEVGGPWVALPKGAPVRARIVHPTLGTLRRLFTARNPWVGQVRIRPFLDFACIAGDRAAFARDPAKAPLRSDLDWDFARGTFSASVHDVPGGFTLNDAAATLATFQSDEAANTQAVLQAILAHYTQTRDEQRQAYRGPDAEAKMPDVSGVEGLRDVIQLSSIEVFAEPGAHGGTLGLVFSGLGKGVGVRWRNGAVEEVGLPKVGRPPRPC